MDDVALGETGFGKEDFLEFRDGDAVSFDRELGRSFRGHALVAEHPDAVVTKMLKVLRKNKVLIDWSQNDAHKTTVSVYSLRATPRPQVSTPLTWPELEKLWRRGDPDAFRFSLDAVLRRIKRHGDLFAPRVAAQATAPLMPIASSIYTQSRTRGMPFLNPRHRRNPR